MTAVVALVAATLGLVAGAGPSEAIVPPTTSCTAAQTRASERFWVFGTRGQIDFGTTGTTATAGLLSTSFSATEGSTTISDTTGNLLFYSNGNTVYDRTGAVMQNGSGLTGSPSATQTVAAFPAIGRPGVYFVVTNTTDYVVSPSGTLYYSEVSMSLNGGLGAVTAVKNIRLGELNKASEALSAIPNSDNTGFWVLTQQAGAANLLAYEFDSNGPTTGTPVATPITPGNSSRTINVSPDLSQIVLNSSGVIRVLDFDGLTGTANERFAWTDSRPTGTGGYSADFSPSGDYVYASGLNGSPRLHRYLIEGQADSAAVEASLQDLGLIAGNGGQVRRGPNARMYVANQGRASLTVVDSPDTVAAPALTQLTLPTFSSSSYGLPQTATGCALKAVPTTPALQTCSAEEVRATQRHWYFGRQANIDFGVSGSTATPQLSPAGAGDVLEGTTVVTDTAGNLQFWSDGQTVYDRDSAPMQNGTGLLGHVSAAQTVAAFPSTVPGRYFVVTTNADSPVFGTLRYSIVDMTLNGGRGAVTATKNVPLGLAGTAGEGLNAIPNSGGTGFWVLTYTPEQPTMLAYEFDGNGPVTGVAVRSTLSTKNPNAFGSINISPDLTQIALLAGSGSAGEAHVLDFDAATGFATDTLAWTLPTGRGGYAMDFSPSGDYVYVSRIHGDPGGELVRYKIDGATNGAAVLATARTIGSGYGFGGAVRRGPDDKMYLANRDATALKVVTNPDAANPAFASSDLPLATGSRSRYGLSQTVTGCAAAAVRPVARAAVVASSTDWTLGAALPGDPLPTFSYGNRPLTPMMGDWNGDGLKTVGTFESGTFRLNNENDGSAAELTFVFGNPRAYAVAGDYDDNGYDDVALYRYGTWEIHYLGPEAPPNQTFSLAAPFGQSYWPYTVPVAGDWDGDGTDGIGTYDYATGTWVLKNKVGTGAPDIPAFVFWAGSGSGSYPVVGDYGGIGVDTLGYRVGVTWTARTAAVTSGATRAFDFGVAGSVPLTW